MFVDFERLALAASGRVAGLNSARPSRAAHLVNLGQHSWQCQKQDFQIHYQRPLRRILDIKLDHAIERRPILPRNLPQPRQAWSRIEAGAL